MKKLTRLAAILASTAILFSAISCKNDDSGGGRRRKRTVNRNKCGRNNDVKNRREWKRLCKHDRLYKYYGGKMDWVQRWLC